MFSIVREKEFDAEVLRLSAGYSRMKDLDEAMDWALSKNPTKITHAVRITGEYYLWVTAEFSKLSIPSVRILYKVDDSKFTVFLMSIEEIMPVSTVAPV